VTLQNKHVCLIFLTLVMVKELDCQKQITGDSGVNLEQETDAKIEQSENNEASRISKDVVEMLLKHVSTVKN
ncbi:hypothetical protein HID58_056666, partial [Brassica napus]